MTADFSIIKPEDIKENLFSLIADRWALLTAGEKGDFNTMTVSWGSFGELWNEKIAIAYVRPQRYTFGFTNRYKYYTLSFFPEEQREALKFCGSHSGRDTDKMKETGLTPLFDENSIYYEEANLVLKCRKLYQDDIKPENFLEEWINKKYPEKGYHRFYIGEIIEVLKK
ncbi:MAG: flavin reductase family protein [candidate division WOR-3 bacterium]|nr:flavin reductase family protein [candidate division WOR-3 bacterium]